MAKIIQLTTFFLPVVGGVESQVEDLAKKLQDNGHEVTILTTNSTRGQSKLEPGWDEYSGFKIFRAVKWFNISQFHKFAPGIFGQLMKLDYDVLHIHGIRKPEMFMGIIAAKLRRKRVVVSTHNPFTTVNRSRLQKLYIALNDLFGGLIWLRFVDRFLLLDDSEKSVLERFGVAQKKMKVVGNAVADIFLKKETDLELAEFKQELLEKHNGGRIPRLICLSTGRVNEVKGFQYLELAAKENPDVIFFIVGGDDGYADMLKKIFRDEENVKFLDHYVNREQLKKFYAVSDLFILPSMHEPFGIVLLEAMSQDCAIIASKSAGPENVLGGGEFGVLVAAGDQKEISEQVRRLKNNPEELQKLRKLARKRVKDFTWETIYPKYHKALLGK